MRVPEAIWFCVFASAELLAIIWPSAELWMPAVEILMAYLRVAFSSVSNKLLATLIICAAA